MAFKINKVEISEIDRVCEILKSVVAYMKKIGFTQWDDDYPRRDILQRDIELNQLYGAYKDSKLVGFIALTNNQDEEYNDIAWQYKSPYLIVHRLQVDPAFRGQRIGYGLMIFAEKLAKDTGCKSIRLDTRQDNTSAINLYIKLGYKIQGHVHFPRMIEYEFPCFEKEIL